MWHRRARMRVGVERAPSWAATTPTLLVTEGYHTQLIVVQHWVEGLKRLPRRQARSSA